jgi:hypothetical protein
MAGILKNLFPLVEFNTFIAATSFFLSGIPHACNSLLHALLLMEVGTQKERKMERMWMVPSPDMLIELICPMETVFFKGCQSPNGG